MNDPLPPPSKPEFQEPQMRSSLALILVLAGGVVVGGVLFLLITPLLAIIPILFVVILAHYLTWGMWMERYLHRRAREEHAVAASKKSSDTP